MEQVDENDLSQVLRTEPASGLTNTILGSFQPQHKREHRTGANSIEGH